MADPKKTAPAAPAAPTKTAKTEKDKNAPKELKSFGTTLRDTVGNVFRVAAKRQKDGNWLTFVKHVTKDAEGNKTATVGCRKTFPSADACQPRVDELVKKAKAEGWMGGGQRSPKRSGRVSAFEDSNLPKAVIAPPAPKAVTAPVAPSA